MGAVIEFPKVKLEDLFEGKRSAAWAMAHDAQDKPAPWIRCANGHLAGLGKHTVADDGTISPSLVCSRDGCDFHKWGRLLEWEPLSA